MDLHVRTLLKEIDLTAGEFTFLIDLAAELRADKRAGRRAQRLAGRNIALIFEKASTRTRSAFEIAAHDEGGHTTYMGPDESRIGSTESIKDTARVLGRMYDGIEFRGFSQESVETRSRCRPRCGLRNGSSTGGAWPPGRQPGRPSDRGGPGADLDPKEEQR